MPRSVKKGAFVDGHLMEKIAAADTDVLVWEEGESEAQLGALYRTCPLEWVNAHGAPIRSVVAWAALPVLREEQALKDAA